MNKIQRNAIAYEKLVDIEYIFYLGYKGKCRKVILRFPKENFQHLEGIGQLKDLVFHQFRGIDILHKALKGEITEVELQKSKEYCKHYTQRKVEYLHLLESFIDNNDIVFNYIHHRTKRSNIQAKIFLYRDFDGKDMYLFLDTASSNEIYYPRSFVVAPELDYRVGQYKYTVLWKEKRNRINGESVILSRYKDFAPEKLSV